MPARGMGRGKGDGLIYTFGGEGRVNISIQHLLTLLNLTCSLYLATKLKDVG